MICHILQDSNDANACFTGIELRKNIYGLDNYGIGKIQWES